MTGMNRGGWTTIGPLAYRGKVGCQSVTCTRRDIRAFMAGEETSCFGWHCSYCDAPCSMMGHKCDASEAVLGEARRAADERLVDGAA